MHAVLLTERDHNVNNIDTRVHRFFFFYFPPRLDLSRVIRSSLLFLSAITWQYNVPIYKKQVYICISYSTKGVFFFFFFFFYEWIHTGHGTTVSNNGFSIRISCTLCFDFNDKYELLLLLLVLLLLLLLLLLCRCASISIRMRLIAACLGKNARTRSRRSFRDPEAVEIRLPSSSFVSRGSWYHQWTEFSFIPIFFFASPFPPTECISFSNSPAGRTTSCRLCVPPSSRVPRAT